MGKWTTNAWPNDPTNSETKKRSCYERLISFLNIENIDTFEHLLQSSVVTKYSV